VDGGGDSLAGPSNFNPPHIAGNKVMSLGRLVPDGDNMSQTSTPLGSLFETQRTLIDRSIETQVTLNRQAVDLTRQAVTPLVGAAPGADDDAEERVWDAFEQIEDAQADLFADLQEAAERGVDTSEEVTGWSVEVVEGLRETAADLEDDVAETAEEVESELEDATADAAETAEDAAESAEEAAAEFLDGLDDGIDATTEEFEEFYGTLSSELPAFDDTAVENLLEEGVESLSDLTSADVSSVAEATDTTEATAQELIDTAVDREGVNLADLEGIGATYADRLAAAGVRTQGDLARTSAEEVAETADVSEERAGEWVQQAQDRA
jgi:predicted flap endonuclease-1-like 5' DNA nuclease/gas vesicle protein